MTVILQSLGAPPEYMTAYYAAFERYYSRKESIEEQVSVSAC
jgi:hypothetical protein